MAIGPVGREHAASAMTEPTRSDVRRGPPGRRGARLSSPVGKRNISPPPTGFPRGFPDRCGQTRIACGPVRRSLIRMESSRRLYRFAGALEGLLAAPDAEAFERAWATAHVDRLAWEALGGARRADSGPLEPALDQVDRRLLAMLQRCRAVPDPHVVTFRGPQLQPWQHAAAAALVGARWGVAGLRTVIADTGAPLGRRYFAFLALAERHLFFFSSRRRHTIFDCDWSSDVCSSDLSRVGPSLQEQTRMPVVRAQFDHVAAHAV